MDNHHDQYLDEPLILPQVELKQLDTLLAILASPALTPLPARLQRQLTALRRQVQAILREVRDHPEALLEERHRDDQGLGSPEGAPGS